MTFGTIIEKNRGLDGRGVVKESTPRKENQGDPYIIFVFFPKAEGSGGILIFSQKNWN